jgi:hypothetical protein
MTSASDYLASADAALDLASSSDRERAHVLIARGQVFAIQAVAAAIQRLAQAVESLAESPH